MGRPTRCSENRRRSKMARAQGARAQLAAAFESVYGTAPVSGFTRLPFASSGLSAEQPLLESELLGYGRDPLAPIKDAITVDGELSVPIDAEAFGFWLKAAFGAPDSSGGDDDDPFEHVFKTGKWDLPSLALEVGMPEVPRFAMYSGAMVDQISWTMQRSGLLTASVQLVAQGEEAKSTSLAGTPGDLELIRFGHFQGTITRNGASI